MTQTNRPGNRPAQRTTGTGTYRTGTAYGAKSEYRSSSSAGSMAGRGRPVSSGRTVSSAGRYSSGSGRTSSTSYRGNSAYRSRAAYARRRKSNETAKFLGLVALLSLIIILAVIQMRKPVGNTQYTVSNNPVQVTQTPASTDTAALTLTAQTSAPVSDPTPVSTVDEDFGLVPTAAGTPAPFVDTQQQSGTTNDGLNVFGTNNGGLRSVRFRFIGDVMVTTDQLVSAKFNGEYDFSGELAYMAPYMANAEFTIANLETTVGKYKNKDYSGYPQFNAPEEILRDLKSCGIDMFTLCNNHMLDRWFDGMKNTVNVVEKYGFQHIGAYRTQAERDSYKIIEINGIKFGFLAYTTSTNTMEDRGCDEAVKIYGVPYFSRADIDADVKKLRNAGAEVIICLPHWGNEYIREPDENQLYYAKKLYQAGVDIIIGSHSHMVQPMGFKTITTSAGQSKEIFIMYSMGNFLSNMTVKHTDSGAIIELTVQETSEGQFRVQNVGFIPTYAWVYGTKDKATCITLPSGDFLKSAPDGMGNNTWARLKESYNDIVSLLGSAGEPLSK